MYRKQTIWEVREEEGWADGPRCGGAMGRSGRGNTGSVELLYRRTVTTVTMDTLSEAKQGKGKQREVFDEKEMEKTNLQ